MDLADSNLDSDTVEAAVMPVVTLSATNSAGQTVGTNVSANEAAFVAGVFSDAVILSTMAQAQLAVNDIVNGLHNNTIAFVLPGKQLLIFPVGLIVTLVWLFLGLIAVGFGTVQRVNFRERFRRQRARQGKAGLSQI